MKQATLRFIRTVFLSAAALGASHLYAGDFPAAHVAAPEQYQVLLENDRVLILKMVLRPGESDSMHSHRDESVYFERGGRATITESNGNVIEVEVPDGHVMWHPAWSHQVTNTGDTEIIAIIVEEK